MEAGDIFSNFLLLNDHRFLSCLDSTLHSSHFLVVLSGTMRKSCAGLCEGGIVSAWVSSLTGFLQSLWLKRSCTTVYDSIFVAFEINFCKIKPKIPTMKQRSCSLVFHVKINVVTLSCVLNLMCPPGMGQGMGAHPPPPHPPPPPSTLPSAPPHQRQDTLSGSPHPSHCIQYPLLPLFSFLTVPHVAPHSLPAPSYFLSCHCLTIRLARYR